MKARASALLLTALAFGFAIELLCHATGNAAALLALGALPDAGGLHGEWWRLTSYAFLHWNASHFVANFALLAWLAPRLELRVGALRLLALFLVAAALSGAAIVVKHAYWPAAGVTVGASGGAFAVLAAMAVMLWRDPQASRRARTAVSIVVAAGLLVSLWPGVSLLGHLGGGAIGAAFAWRQSPRTISPVSTLRSTPGAPAGASAARIASK